MATAERLRRLGAAARASAEAATADREARDDEIEEADQQHWTLRQIAREVGLAPGHVGKIVLARTAARQARLRGSL